MGRRRLGTFQMLWDCSCGAGPLLGVDHRHCPSCGRPQDPRRRYFPDQRDAVPAPQWMSGSGVDRYCPYCASPNAAAARFCAGCGGPMDGSRAVERRDANHGVAAETVHDALSEARREAQERREAQRAVHAPARQRTREEGRAERQATRRSEAVSRKRRSSPPRPVLPGRPSLGAWRDHPRRVAAAAGGVLALLLSVWAIFLWEKAVTAEVASRTWERAQVVERFVQLSDSTWCDDKPSDAYDVREERRKRGTRTVVDCRDCDCHTERVKVDERCRDVNCRTIRTDNGNGSFDVHAVCDRVCDPVYEDQRTCEDRTHEEPVYDDWCRYSVDRWRPHRTPSRTGTSLQEPTWPVLDLRECGDARDLGCERPGARSERYVVEFEDVESGDTYECVYPQATWREYPEGSLWQATVKRLGGRFQCDSLVRTQVEVEI